MHRTEDNLATGRPESVAKIPRLIARERAAGVTDWEATPGQQSGEVTGNR